MSLKRDFLQKWKLCLQASNSSKDMSVTERKKVIKLSADVAMASTRHQSTHWSRSVIRQHKCVTTRTRTTRTRLDCGKRIVKRSKKMLTRKKKSDGLKASCVAKRLVSKRTRVLKSLLPGGKDIIDEYCLIEEALDYIVSLQAQVDVMKCIANASLLLSNTTSS